jgi:hypothetical protein
VVGFPSSVRVFAWISLIVLASAFLGLRAAVAEHHLPSGPRTGGITYSMAWLRWVQRQVDHGNKRYRFYLDPVQTTLHSLPHLGYTGSPIELVAPTKPKPVPTAHHGEDGLPENDVVVRWRGRQYWVVLNQFICPGPTGIWSVITITPM